MAAVKKRPSAAAAKKAKAIKGARKDQKSTSKRGVTKAAGKKATPKDKKIVTVTNRKGLAKDAGQQKVADGVAEFVLGAIRKIRKGEVATINDLAFAAFGRSGQYSKIQVAVQRKLIPEKDRSIPWWRSVDDKIMSDKDPRLVLQRKLLTDEGVKLPLQQRTGPTYFLEAHRVRRIIEHPASSSHTTTLIYLHGHMFSPGYYADHSPHFFGTGTSKKTALPIAGLRVVLEPAPWREFSRTGGVAETSWGYTSHGRSDPDGLRSVLKLITEESARLKGVPGGKLLLGGCSEGCMTGFDAFFLAKEEVAGFIGCIGLCFTEADVIAKAAGYSHKRKALMRLCSSTKDTTIPWSLAGPSYQKLTSKGFNTEVVLDHKSGHAIGELEGTWIREFLATMMS